MQVLGEQHERNTSYVFRQAYSVAHVENRILGGEIKQGYWEKTTGETTSVICVKQN